MSFGTVGRKLFEQGLSVIPCRGKVPVILGWQRFSKALPQESEISEWESRYPDLNVGLVLGPASGLVCLDIDRDDIPELPVSPVIRRGKKGEARFFKYREGLDSRNFHAARIDFLSSGKQVIIDGIHPETNEPYKWGIAGLEESPEWPKDGMGRLESLEATGRKTAVSNTTGRNNRLKEIACAMFAREEPFESVVSELLTEDAKHEPPLFTDKSEGFGNDAAASATRFTASILQSLARRGLSLVKPAEPEASIDLRLLVHRAKEPPPAEESPWVSLIPRSGLIRILYDYQHDIANDESPALFLGGALAFVSALCGNKFTFMGAAPNLYVFNVARTGAGKSTPYEMLGKFFAPLGILGAESVKSASALVKGFDAQQWRTRIDPLDEVGGLLGLIKRGGAFQAEIIDAFCGLYSASNKYYGGIKYSSSEKSVGGCWQPYYVALMSTTKENLSENHVKNWSDKGFLPRFLIFHEESAPGYKDRGDGHREVPAIEEAIARLMGMPENLIDVKSKGPLNPRAAALSGAAAKYAQIELKPSIEAAALLSALGRKYRLERAIEEQGAFSGAGAGFVNRHLENILKVAAILAISETLDMTQAVEVEHVKHAQAIVEQQYSLAKEMLEDIHVDGLWPKVSREIESVIKLRGRVSKTDLFRALKNKPWWNSDLFHKVIMTLREAEIITEYSQRSGTKGGRPITTYVWGALESQDEAVKDAVAMKNLVRPPDGLPDA